MAKKPADRFADGEAMAAALRAWAPTAILLAEPLAGQAADALPNWMVDADKSTASVAYGSAKPGGVPDRPTDHGMGRAYGNGRPAVRSDAERAVGAFDDWEQPEPL